MKLIVGLGNPGPKYERTRHNVGFWAIDQLSKQLNVNVNRAKFQSLVAETRIASEVVLLMKPQTFMNLSGDAVEQAVSFYKLDVPSDVIVIYDEMDFAPGQLKLRQSGSAGGHNGIKSIIARLGTEAFCRVRIGIGRPLTGAETIGHVLGTFSPAEAPRVEAAAKSAADAAMYAVEHGFHKAMNRFNQVSF